MDDMEARAREYKVYDLSEFYACAAFRADGFEAIFDERVIRRRFV